MPFPVTGIATIGVLLQIFRILSCRVEEVRKSQNQDFWKKEILKIKPRNA